MQPSLSLTRFILQGGGNNWKIYLIFTYEARLKFSPLLLRVVAVAVVVVVVVDSGKLLKRLFVNYQAEKRAHTQSARERESEASVLVYYVHRQQKLINGKCDEQRVLRVGQGRYGGRQGNPCALNP